MDVNEIKMNEILFIEIIFKITEENEKIIDIKYLLILKNPSIIIQNNF